MVKVRYEKRKNRLIAVRRTVYTVHITPQYCECHSRRSNPAEPGKDARGGEGE